MAFRIKAAAYLIFTTLLSAGEYKYPVRHVHARKGATGTLTLTETGVSFEEPGKKSEHSRTWKYEEIQRFDLSPGRLRILTYEDVRWQLGRDREYTFDRLPDKMAAQLYPMLSARLDQRFVAEVPNQVPDALWSMPAKMLRGRSGSNGALEVGSGRIVFASSKDSRTWRYSDILAIASENPFELTIASLDRETRIQLKQNLSEDRYNDLWRRVSEANGLHAFHSTLENHHD
jgi:hypothetical protein